MDKKISVVINTLNEEKNITRVIKGVLWADEIIVCDMYSEDNTVQIAKRLGAKVIFHKRVNFVEPARNFAISKASNDWILILDSDEEIPRSLAERLKEMVAKPIVSDFVEIPRKNIIFGKWMKASGWWPDYQVRFFKKGKVIWSDKIHSQPQADGEQLILSAEEKYAIVHHNYQTVGQFIERMNRYTSVEAEQLIKQGYQFKWRDLVEKPLGEFLSRFFGNKGFEDGLHGLTLSFLQGLSFLVVYLKIWENTKFKEESVTISDFKTELDKSREGLNYWFKKTDKRNFPFSDFLKVFRRR